MNVTLQDLLAVIDPVSARAADTVASRPVSGVTSDSRQVQPGTVMVCIAGTVVDGHHFAEQAASRGALALVVERDVDVVAPVPVVRVRDGRHALARMADRFFGHPSGDIDVFGVTGTNGKTSVVSMASAIGERAGWNPGAIGTLGIRHGDRVSPSPNTTPGPEVLQRALREMADNGARAAMVEVSSHALDMFRVTGTEFKVVAFTNFTRDHLDFHETMDQYRDVKARLFDRDTWEAEASPRDDDRLAILPAGDDTADWIADRTTLPVARVGFERGADWQICDPWSTALESGGRLEGRGTTIEFRVPMPGRFNLMNAAEAAIACRHMGATDDSIRRGLSDVGRVPGRMEAIVAGQPFAVVVDYAHTPDAIRVVLAAAREFTERRLWCVVGCGGDRDPGKRPEMALAAVDGSDQVVFTSDNPRHEDPEHILDDMVQPLQSRPRNWQRIVDRAEAIAAVIAAAGPGDTVVVAGKGHETTQDIGGRKSPSDDRDLCRSALAGLGFDRAPEPPDGGGK